MILKDRIACLAWLGEYMRSDAIGWKQAKHQASIDNGWFIPEFIELAVKNIAQNFLNERELNNWANHYNIPASNSTPKTVGIVMAGNIPLVGFHDLLCVFISGHKARIKPSSKDQVLIKHLVEVLSGLNSEIKDLIQSWELLKGCDAYITTGSNNTSRYFQYYFGKYRHIIRRNKTSVAVLDGNETENDLEKLADDVYQFFGLGCRNVTKLYVPSRYNFEALLAAFKKYDYIADHHKYKNNYDYNLTLHILNNKFYMTNDSILLVESPSVFSPISQLSYEYYTNRDHLINILNNDQDIQVIVGKHNIPFGEAQSPGLFDYADKADTVAFLQSL